MNNLTKDLETVRKCISASSSLPYEIKRNKNILTSVTTNKFCAHETLKHEKCYLLTEDIGYGFLAILIGSLVLGVAANIIIPIIWLIYDFIVSDKHDYKEISHAFRAKLYEYPIYFGEKLLKGKRGLFTSEPLTITKTFIGFLIISLILCAVVFVLFFVFKLILYIINNYLYSKELNNAKNRINELKSDPEKYHATVKSLEEAIQYDEKLLSDCKHNVYKLKAKHNIPDNYLTVENITLLINYINSGRAIDVTGAINQIKYDADQQQLLRAQQQAAEYNRRAAEYNRQLAMDAKRTADASERAALQAELNFWFEQATKKK